MDRNSSPKSEIFGTPVALRKESVDRNHVNYRLLVIFLRSLSARRAWIEIITVYGYCLLTLSLSARRAWIEMVLAVAGAAIPIRRSPQGERG